jgi:hypothetical protein
LAGFGFAQVLCEKLTLPTLSQSMSNGLFLDRTLRATTSWFAAGGQSLRRPTSRHIKIFEGGISGNPHPKLGEGESRMDTGVIIAIVVGAVVLVALVLVLVRQAQLRRLDARRDRAREMRRHAEVSRARADRTHAEAEERAARARREEATARERAAAADEQRREARERHLDAARTDPDADEDEVAGRFDREGDGSRGTDRGKAASRHREQ